MTSSLYYRFKNVTAQDFNMITFEGTALSIQDIKREIIEQKKLHKDRTGFDLELSDANTGESYTEDSTLIPKNTSLIIKRVPSNQFAPLVISLTNTADATDVTNASEASGKKETESNTTEQTSMETNTQIAFNQTRSPQDTPHEINRSISSIHANSNLVFNPYQKPPGNYICHKCGIPGHLIKYCDYFKQQRQSHAPNDHGLATINQMNQSMPTVDLLNTAGNRNRLNCPLCKGVFSNPVVIKCCFGTFCNECIRQNLLLAELEQRSIECPQCRSPIEMNDLDSMLQANEMLQLAVINGIHEKSSNPGSENQAVVDDLPNHSNLSTFPQNSNLQISCTFCYSLGHLFPYCPALYQYQLSCFQQQQQQQAAAYMAQMYNNNNNTLETQPIVTLETEQSLVEDNVLKHNTNQLSDVEYSSSCMNQRSRHSRSRSPIPRHHSRRHRSRSRDRSHKGNDKPNNRDRKDQRFNSKPTYRTRLSRSPDEHKTHGAMNQKRRVVKLVNSRTIVSSVY